MKTLYQEILESGVEIGNNYSDLYFPVTEQTTLILNKFPLEWGNHKTFINQNDKKRWYDVPFAYMPYWEEKQKRV